MKIVALSDTHGLHNEVEVPDGDILIHAGDFCIYGKPKEVENFNEWIKKQPHPYKIIVGGNHDWRLRDTYKKTFTDAIYLNNESVEINGLFFYGSPETPIIRYDKPWVYKRESDYVKELWAKIPDKTDVLITHGPPLMILDMNDTNNYCGCADLLSRVIKIKPKLHIFGHIHESYGVIEQRYGIKFVNCSLLDENFKLKNKPVVVEI